MTARDFFPKRITLPALVRAARSCQGCDLYKGATQTVFGEGPSDAPVMFVGEMPGDREDTEGHPFVGPAGRLLDEGLREVGLDRDEVYITNVVKHYKWEPRGKRRLHKKPAAREVAACRPWLEAEFELLQPHVVVCLGATAAQWLLGRSFRITRQRGQILESEWAPWTMATWHPSAVLRAPDKSDRDRMRGELVSDLQLVSDELSAIRASAGG